MILRRRVKQAPLPHSDVSIERLASGTRDNLTGFVVDRALGLALTLALPLLLTTRALGGYYEITAILSICVTLGLLGLDIGVVRFTALASAQSKPERAREYLSAALTIGFATSALVVAGLVMSAGALEKVFQVADFGDALRVGALAIPLMVGANLLVAPSRGWKSMWPTVVVLQLTQPSAQLLFTFAFIAAGFSLVGAVGAFTASSVLASVTALYLLLRRRLPGRRLATRGRARELIGFSIPVSGILLVDIVLLWMDALLLGVFRSANEVAVYGVSVRLVGIGSALLIAINQIFGPFVTHLMAKGDTEELHAKLKVATRWAMLISAPWLVLLMLWGSLPLQALRQSRPGGAVVLSVLSAGFITAVITGPVGQVLLMSGRSVLELINVAASLICNVVLNLLLIPRFGMMGAAVAWAAVIIGVNVARVVEVRVLFGIGPFGRTLWKPTIAIGVATVATISLRFALMAAGVHVLLPRLAVMGAVFGITYGAVTLGIGIEREDWTLLKTLAGRRVSRD
jgi:O-antigen/teichoic acid export membrane protein